MIVSACLVPSNRCMSDSLGYMRTRFPCTSTGDPFFVRSLGVVPKVKNIGFDRYIGIWILQIYQRYISEYFYTNINISKIKKNTLKFIEILCKSVKIMKIIKNTY